MGMQARWVCTCDGCGLEHVREEVLDEHNWDGTWEYLKQDWGNTTCTSWSYDNTAWGPGVPNGWLQISYDEETDQHYLFFHSAECYIQWLRKQGRFCEISDFENAVWLA